MQFCDKTNTILLTIREVKRPLLSGSGGGKLKQKGLGINELHVTLETLQDAGFRGSISGPIAERSQSAIYRLDRVDGEPLAIKRYYQQGTNIPDAGMAMHQFADLTVCNRALGQDPIFRVPEPLFIAPDQAIVAMEWVEGNRLIDYLLKHNTPLRILLSNSRLAGSWLRTFHRAGLDDIAGCDVFKLSNEVQVIADAMKMDDRLPTCVEEGIVALSRFSSFVSTKRCLRSWLHGDCNPSNFIFGNSGKVYGIDITFLSYGNAAADVAKFLNYLARIPLNPFKFHLIFRCYKAAGAFLSGYGPIDEALLNWYRLADDVRHVVRHHRGLPQLHRLVFTAVQAAAIRMHIVRLARLAETSS